MPPRPERPEVVFLFRRDQSVQIASTGRTYVIQRQRYETREILGPLVTYRLRGRKMWVDEADLRPVEEDARAEGLPP